MFTVGELPPPIATEHLACLAQCETATIGHFLHSQFMDPAMRAVIPSRRVAGAAIDGPATDFEEIRRTGVPVWCRGPSPVTVKRLGLSGAFCVPVSCGGVMVRPGDAILADESGIVVIRPDQIEWVVEEALKRQAAEPETIRRLRAGEKLHAISGAGAQVAAAMRRG
jgi:regulator of RNase E activity RraA